MALKWPDPPPGGWPSDDATAYALSVAEGKTIAGPHVQRACRRHLGDLKDGPGRGLVWDTGAVDRVVGFFSDVLRLAGGRHEGRPFDLLPWQCFVVGNVFGWQWAATGLRRFRVAYVETGKGSGKSPLAAGIGVYMLVADGESRAEVYAAATKKDQAMILFRDAVAMVDQSPDLSQVIRKSGSAPVWNLAYPPTHSFFRPISSDDSQSGPRPHCGLIDELHEHRSDHMVEMMRAGLKGREQPLLFMITNAGVDRTSVCYDRHSYAVQVAEGQFPAEDTDSFFGFVCSVGEKDDPLEDPADEELGFPRSWAKANPSLQTEPERRTVPVSYLEEQVKEARGIPAKQSTVRRLNFCQWVEAESPWISHGAWQGVQVEALPHPVTEGPAFMALDLSGKRDLTALAEGWEKEDEVLARLKFWTPGDSLHQRAREDRVPYDLWVREGHLEAVPGGSIDYGHIAAYVRDRWQNGGVVGLAFDPYRIDDFERELDRLGVPYWRWEGPDVRPGDGIMMVAHGQGFGGGASDKLLWMPRSIGALEDRILAGTLRVESNPVLTWNVASAVLTTDATENRKWEKRKSRARIDGAVALSMLVGLIDGLDRREQASVYETRGLVSA